MPRGDVLIGGMRSPQAKPTNEPKRFEYQPDTGKEVTFESRHRNYRIQLNTPGWRYDQMTGQRVKDPNKVIVFRHGLYSTSDPDEIQAIIGSSFFGAPKKSNVWRRSERQRLEASAAVEDLIAQVKETPELLVDMAARLRAIPGMERVFNLVPKVDGDGEANPESNQTGEL